MIQAIKNFSANIFKSIVAIKKASAAYSQEEMTFAREKYSAAHDEIVAVNVYVFLVGSGCIEVQPNTGSLHLNHNLLTINELLNTQGSFLSHPQLQTHLNQQGFIV